MINEEGRHSDEKEIVAEKKDCSFRRGRLMTKLVSRVLDLRDR
jgi:hypothetical protein